MAKEEKSKKFLNRMWKTYFPRDRELPDQQMVASTDLARMIEGYSGWYNFIHDPERQRAYALIDRIANRIEKDIDQAMVQAQKIVDDRLDAATSYQGVGHSVMTNEAVVELVADVLSGRVTGS